MFLFCTLIHFWTHRWLVCPQITWSASIQTWWSPHPGICPSCCSSSFITDARILTEHKKKKKSMLWSKLLHGYIYCIAVLAILNINIYIWKAEYCKFSIIQYVHSSISFLRNKIFRKTEKELQTSYTLFYHHSTKTWYCSCETDIEVTKSDLEDISNFKTEVRHGTWYPAHF